MAKRIDPHKQPPSTVFCELMATYPTGDLANRAVDLRPQYSNQGYLNQVKTRSTIKRVVTFPAQAAFSETSQPANVQSHNEIILASAGKIPYNPLEQTPNRPSMSLPETLPTAVVETILTHLAALLLTGAGGNTEAARQAANQMLASYHPETADELRLAANIVSFSLQALEALAQAAAPDLPITPILRLRGSAVSLSRESAKAERRLAQLQKARQQATQAEPQPEPAPPESKPQPIVAQAAKTNGQSWTKAYENHQRELRIAANIKKAEARAAAQPAIASPNHSTMANVL